MKDTQRILERGKPHVTFTPELLLSIPVCFLPLYAYPFLVFASESLALPTPLSDPILALITLLVFQVVSGALLVDVIMITKAQSLEKALIPVFFCFYIASIATLGFHSHFRSDNFFQKFL